jgi:hypothetical protein
MVRVRPQDMQLLGWCMKAISSRLNWPLLFKCFARAVWLLSGLNVGQVVRIRTVPAVGDLWLAGIVAPFSVPFLVRYFILPLTLLNSANENGASFPHNGRFGCHLLGYVRIRLF